MAYYGSWKIDDLLTFAANTHRFDTGAATDADSAPSYRVYEDETSTPLLTGSMALLDGSNTAGFYSEQITLSAANGFEKGKSYTIYIQATVNSVTAATHHNFQLEAEVDANAVSNLNANVITAASIATGAIDADAIADNAIDAGAIAADAITAAKIADGAIDAATFAAGAITASAIAADAIGASELAADAVTEIQSGLATAASIAALNNLSAAQVNAEVDAALADIRLDELLATDSDIDGAAPPTVGSVFHELMSKTAGSFTYDQTTDSNEALRDRGDAAWITATGFSTLSQADIRTAVGLASNNLDTQLAALPTAGENADAVWEEPIADHSGTAGSTAEALNAAGAAGDPWTTALPGAYGAGSAGNIIGNNLNATVSSRATQASLDTVDNNVDSILADTGTDGVVVAAGSKTGYSLSAAGIQAIWDALTSALTTAGSIGKLLVDNINATISSRLASASYTTPPTVTQVRQEMDSNSTQLAAIKAKTDNLPTDPADQSAVEAAITAAVSPLALQSSVDDLEGRLTAARAGYLDNLSAGAVALQSSVDDLEGRLTAQRATNLDNLDAAISTRATPAQVNTEVVDVVGTDIIPDSVAADGSRPTINQALLMISRFLMEKSVSSTTVTVKKEDGSTNSMTFTLDNDTTPTSITRSG